MKIEDRLKISIKALIVYGIGKEILMDILNDLELIISEKNSEIIAKEHLRENDVKALVELSNNSQTKKRKMEETNLRIGEWYFRERVNDDSFDDIVFLTKIEDKWVYGFGYLMGEFDDDLGWEKGGFINEFKALIKEDIFVK